jgi:NAD(P)-dependent dehydrogenase (short-subunit alcohol dehydrogenase family)
MTAISLKGKVIIVTGGGRGLGRAMALGFARAGALGVTVTSISSPDEITAVAKEIDAIAGPGHGLAMRADVGQWAHCQKVVAQTVSTFGALHILVNNAARGPRYTSEQRGPFWEADPEGWRGVVDTNINGPFYMAKAAAPHLLTAKWGRVINISKTRDSMHAAKITPYGMSKAALEAATLSWAQDFAGTGVTVNSLAPGGPTDSGFETIGRHYRLPLRRRSLGRQRAPGRGRRAGA